MWYRDSATTTRRLSLRCADRSVGWLDGSEEHYPSRQDAETGHTQRAFRLQHVHQHTTLQPWSCQQNKESSLGVVLLPQTCRAFVKYSSLQACAMNRTCSNLDHDYAAAMSLATKVNARNPHLYDSSWRSRQPKRREISSVLHAQDVSHLRFHAWCHLERINASKYSCTYPFDAPRSNQRVCMHAWMNTYTCMHKREDGIKGALKRASAHAVLLLTKI